MATQPITYTPQFQPPDWQDNVDLVAAAGANGFNIQFQNLRAELDALSSIIQQLSKQVSDINNAVGQASQDAANAVSAASAATTAATNATNTANTANSAISSKSQIAKWGQIKDDGTILSGSGDFTASVVSGPTFPLFFYDISFNSPFPSIPAVNVTVNAYRDEVTRTDATTLINAVVVGVNQNKCRIMTGFTNNGFPVPSGFSFIAYCPA